MAGLCLVSMSQSLSQTTIRNVAHGYCYARKSASNSASRDAITINPMQHYVHNNRGVRGTAEAYEGVEHSLLGYGHAHLVHQELEELRQFAPLHHVKSDARERGTSLSSAKQKLTTLVRYVYLSLF